MIISQETMNSSADLLVLHSCFIVRKTTSYDFNSLKRNGKCVIIRRTYRIFAVSERKTKRIYSRTNTRGMINTGFSHEQNKNMLGDLFSCFVVGILVLSGDKYDCEKQNG